MIKLVDVVKSYVSDGGEAIEVLKGISLDVKEGEALALTGPSGSGKSTLLNLIGALDRPCKGSVEIAGKSPLELSDDELADLRRDCIGFVFQQHHLLPQCTLLENVLLPVLASSPKVDKATEERAMKLLERVGLADRVNHFPSQLSGGESQRAAVVRALINQPKLLLADEPTGSLDHKNALALTELLLELHQEEGMTLVMVTHSLELANKLQRQIAISEGKLRN